MTKADLFIELEFSLERHQAAFTAALGLQHGAVKVIMGGGDYPDLGTCDAFVEIWPITGNYRTRAVVFLVSDQAVAAEPDDATLGRQLAAGLGCGVCLGMDDPDPWKFTCFRPEEQPTAVTLDFERFDKDERLWVRPYVNVWAGAPWSRR